MPWWIESDQLLTVGGLRDTVTGAYVNMATVEATMYEADGLTEVGGQTWPLALSYVPASDGDYVGILQDARMLEDGRVYWIEVVADAGADVIKTWRWRDVARYPIPADG